MHTTRLSLVLIPLGAILLLAGSAAADTQPTTTSPGTGKAPSTQTGPVTATTPVPSTDQGPINGQLGTLLKTDSGVQFRVRAVNAPRRGHPFGVTIEFLGDGSSNGPLGFQPLYNNPVQFIVANPQTGQSFHFTPQQFAPNQFSTDLTLPNAGNYVLFPMFQPVGSQRLIRGRIPFYVQSGNTGLEQNGGQVDQVNPDAANLRDQAANNVAGFGINQGTGDSGGNTYVDLGQYQVMMSPQLGALTPNPAGASFNFQVQQNGQPIPNLRPDMVWAVGPNAGDVFLAQPGTYGFNVNLVGSGNFGLFAEIPTPEGTLIAPFNYDYNGNPVVTTQDMTGLKNQ